MDPGGVVWLPGSGFNDQEANYACEEAYPGTTACEAYPWGQWMIVECC
jgi:hypothetical protein